MLVVVFFLFVFVFLLAFIFFKQMYLLVFVAAVVNIEKSHSTWQVLLPGKGKTYSENTMATMLIVSKLL